MALPELRSSVLMLWTDTVVIVILQGNRVSSIITSTFSTYKILNGGTEDMLVEPIDPTSPHTYIHVVIPGEISS